MNYPHSIAASLALAGTALLCLPGTADAAGSSHAAGIVANFEIDHIATQYGPIAGVSGSGAAAYDNVENVAHESDTVPLDATMPTPTLFVDAHHLISHVKSTGIGVDSSSVESGAGIGSLSLMVNLYPLPPAAQPPVPQPLLQITGSNIVARSNAHQFIPGPVTLTGGARFDSLTISGSLVGGGKLHFSGPVKPNTVIYETPSVTITLNKQVEFGAVTCDKTVCKFTVLGMTTQAVDVNMVKVKWYGRKITGDLSVGEANVSYQ